MFQRLTISKDDREFNYIKGKVMKTLIDLDDVSYFDVPFVQLQQPIY
jgi:hypothetical protein